MIDLEHGDFVQIPFIMFLLTGALLNCSHPETNRSISPEKNADRSRVSEEELREIRTAKEAVTNNLPVKQIEWTSHLGFDEEVVNVWSDAQYLYLETEGHDLWAVSRRTGNPVWTYSFSGPLKFPPTTVMGVPEQVLSAEEELREVNNKLSTEKAAINPDQEEIKELQSRQSDLQSRLESIRSRDYLFLIVGPTLHVVNRKYGNQLNRKSLDFAPSAQPFSTGNRLVIPGYTRNFIYFYNTEKGLKEQLDERVRMDSPVVTQLNQVEDLFLIPTQGGTLYGYSLENGWVWRKKTDGEIAARPVSYEGNVILASRGMQLYSLNRFSGNENWTRHLETPISQTPWITGSTIYVRDEKNRFLAVRGDSGETKWRHKSGPRSFLFQNKGQVYAKNSSEQQVYVLSGNDGQVVNTGTYSGFSYLLQNRRRPVFLLVSKHGLIVSARAAEAGVEFTTENIGTSGAGKN